MKSDPPIRCQRLATVIALPRSRSSNHDKEDVTTSSGASLREALFDNPTECHSRVAAKAQHAHTIFPEIGSISICGFVLGRDRSVELCRGGDG